MHHSRDHWRELPPRQYLGPSSLSFCAYQDFGSVAQCAGRSRRGNRCGYTTGRAGDAAEELAGDFRVARRNHDLGIRKRCRGRFDKPGDGLPLVIGWIPDHGKRLRHQWVPATRMAAI